MGKTEHRSRPDVKEAAEMFAELPEAGQRAILALLKEIVESQQTEQ